MTFDARLQIVQAATDVVLRRLDGLPASAKAAHLRARVEECMQDAEQWNATPPSPREQDVIMKRILALHVEVTSLERDAAVGTAKDGVVAHP